MGLVYPKGTTIPFQLPPHSKILTGDPLKDDATDLIVAALCTNFFPQAKEQFITLINKNLSLWKYTYRPPSPKPNRAQRRAKRKVK